MNKRNIYRKWWNPDSDMVENYLLISPNGTMHQISFNDGTYNERCVVSKTSPLNPLNPNVFIKHKEVSTKSEWEEAKKRAQKLLK